MTFAVPEVADVAVTADVGVLDHTDEAARTGRVVAQRSGEGVVDEIRVRPSRCDRHRRSGAPVSDLRPGTNRMSAVACAGLKIGASTSHAAPRRSFLPSPRFGPAVEAVTQRLAGFTSSGLAGETVRNFATIDGKCFKR